MARGTEIIVSADPRGHFVEGVIAAGEAPKPGQIVQIQPATDLVGGRHTWEIYNADADGGRPKGPFIVLLPDRLQGRTETAAYAAGERAFGYVPLPGDELNLLLADVTAGTGTGATADHTKGEMLIVDDTTGKMIATTGSPETEVAMLLETVNDVIADQLVWVIWTGY